MANNNNRITVNNTQTSGLVPIYIYSENQSGPNYEQMSVNSTTENSVSLENNEEFNDLSDLFSSSQGDILDCELSDIQDVNDLMSSIKSSPLRSLIFSPQKLTEDESPNMCKQLSQFIEIETVNFSPMTSGYVSTDNTIYQANQSEMSFISPNKTNHEDGNHHINSKKLNAFSPSQVSRFPMVSSFD